MTQRKSPSKGKSGANAPPLPFKNEAEEARWFTSPAGRRHSERQLEKAISAGTLRKGPKVKPTDPSLAQELIDRVTARQTQAVSLRLPVADINAAKKIATQTGLGYQTILKEIISKALRNV